MSPRIHERRHRLARECYQGLVTVSFTACVEDRKIAFHDAEVVSEFLLRLHQATEKNDCLALIYCFMPDHFHVILRGRSAAADTWRAMVNFKQQTGFWLGRHLPETSWQKDFYDHIVRADEELGAQIRYIADNPVRRGLVKVWHEYPFTGSLGIDLKIVMADATTL